MSRSPSLPFSGVCLALSLTLATSATAADAPKAFPPPVAGWACPATFAGRALSGGAVYDGPPEEMATLKEDCDVPIKGGRASIWPVAYVRDFNRDVYLTCIYGDRGTAVVVKVPRSVNTCRYFDRGRRQSLVCR